jgi:hypothetical protein
MGTHLPIHRFGVTAGREAQRLHWCTDDEMLFHGQQPGIYVRGFLVLDLLLGKN